ncbi:MAG: single-stranded-DNA-specific exonuclease RecJ, partial [Dehalococcoidia bacterium]
GIVTLPQLRAFLDPDKALLSDPRLLPDIEPAIERLAAALKRRELIAIHGDFDSDGVTATALLHLGLSALGGRTTPYIPHRTEEGHGLSMQGLESIRGLGASLIVTADCGISSFAEVEAARDMGIDVIITDHHSVPPQIPRALAVIDPKREDSEYPFPYLASVGVSYKVVHALRAMMGQPEDESSLDLVALGTVADLAPLSGENRYLVKRGIEVLNSTTNPGIREMASMAGLSMGRLDTESISYALAPRINAAGRVDHAITSYRLLTATSPTEARPLAEELDLRNRERQKQTADVLEQAREQAVAALEEDPLLLVGSEDYPAGVVGLAASRLVEEHHRPAIVLALGKEVSRASARSIPEFDMIAALRRCQDLFLRYGGHSQAAGFVILNENLEPLRHRLMSIAEEQLAGVELQPSIQIDLELSLREVKGRLIKLIGLMAPFGYGNPPPTFLSRGIRVVNARVLGDEGKHLRLKLRDGPVVWDAIGFDLGDQADHLAQALDIVYRIKVDHWGGRNALQLELLDLAPSCGSSESEAAASR